MLNFKSNLIKEVKPIFILQDTFPGLLFPLFHIDIFENITNIFLFMFQ